MRGHRMTEAEKAALWDVVAPLLRELDPVRRSSPETSSCVFCHADATYEYYGGEAPRLRKVYHAESCPWRLAANDHTRDIGLQIG